MGLCVAAFVLLFAAGDRLRARHLRARSRRFERLVHERTRELEASREQLRILATQDGLTGMLNHLAIMEALNAELERARREGRTLVVAMVDLDHFKRVNDAYGHLAGDEALRTFAAALSAATRFYDHAGRYGGEEFLLVLANVPREAAAGRLANLHRSISNIEVRFGESSFRITCSVGAVVFNPGEGFERAESLLASADAALYAAKENGRNRVILHDPNAVASRQMLMARS